MKLKYWYLLSVCVVFLLSCDDDNNPSRAIPGEYFPLDKSYRWEYVRVHEYNCDCDNNGVVLTDTLDLKVGEEFDWNGKKFSLLLDQRGYSFKLIRKDGLEYFEQPAYAWEYKFLDVSKALNESWSVFQYDSTTETTFTMSSVNGTKMIHGINYNNVIEISRVRDFTNPETHERFVTTVLYYYAKDVGLIYSIETYNGENTIEFTLISHSAR